MKKKFSKHWKKSKQSRKQRKYLANAPLHIKRKFLSVNLSKELRKKYGKRNIPIRKGDTIKIMRGKFKKKEGKVAEVNTKMQKIFVQGIQVKKQDGSKVNVPIKASNLQIISLNIEDRKRIKEKGKEKTKKELRNSKKIKEKNMGREKESKIKEKE